MGSSAILSTVDGFAIRRRNFVDEILFYAPGILRYQTEEFSPESQRSFVPVSLTGAQCALQCDHCKGKLLESMLAVRSPEHLWEVCAQLAEEGTKGVLITGGCDSTGRVPLLRFATTLERIKRELSLKVVVHTGLVDEELAILLAEVGVQGAMLDIIGSDETIKTVYHLNTDIESYEHSLERLTRHGIPTIPHVVLGLDYGRILGEDTALEIIARYAIVALVLVVITPMNGTAMGRVEPPTAKQIQRLFRKSRCLLPQTPIILGCARPMGIARRVIDSLAVDCGLNGIAYPSEGIIAYAQKKGLSPRFYEECCSLAYTEVQRKDSLC